MKLEQSRVTIVGLGLMGGSLARALRPLGPEVTGVDSDPGTLALARQLDAVDRVESDLAEALESCDLAILAAPVRACVALIQRMGRDLPPPSRLLDLGSTKSAIADAMHGLPAGCDPLGGHPMCGKETSGLLSSDPTLYSGATFALTPLERTSEMMLNLGRDLARAVGARPLIISAAEHDRLVAFSSHLPFLTAAGLMMTVEPPALTDRRLWDLLGPGFRDSSRLAGGNVPMMMDILSTNRTHIDDALQGMIGALEQLRSKLLAGDEIDLADQLRKVQERRRWLESNHPPGRQP
jgi:prephenate dehydrogenase